MKIIGAGGKFAGMRDITCQFKRLTNCTLATIITGKVNIILRGPQMFPKEDPLSDEERLGAQQDDAHSEKTLLEMAQRSNLSENEILRIIQRAEKPETLRELYITQQDNPAFSKYKTASLENEAALERLNSTTMAQEEKPVSHLQK